MEGYKNVTKNPKSKNYLVGSSLFNNYTGDVPYTDYSIFYKGGARIKKTLIVLKEFLENESGCTVLVQVIHEIIR